MSIDSKYGVFCTTAPIVQQGHGGGSVSYHELEALKKCIENVKVITPLAVNNNPFIQDYFTALALEESDNDIAFVNGATWNAVLSKCRPNKIIVDCPAHDLEMSIDEFGKLGSVYPFEHMTNPTLFSAYTSFIQTADVVLVPSQMSKDYLMKNPGTSGKVIIIPHGVDLPLPEYIHNINTKTQFNVGYLGADGPDKGLVYLLRAWAGLMYQDSELIIAGCTPNLDWPVRWKVKPLGRIENVSDLYNQISVYVQPSVTEGFGLPVLEAMAHGVPVIVSEGAGASELVTHDFDGLIVPRRDPGAIADAIRYMKDNPDKLSFMAANARKTAEQYPWAKIEQQYVDMINELLQD